MKRNIIFWGAAGQAKVLRECLADAYKLIALFDNNPLVEPPFPDVPLYYGSDGFASWRRENPDPDMACLIAIGGDKGEVRVELQNYLMAYGLTPITAVHRTAFVADDAHIGAGSQILAQSAVCVGVEMGLSCIVNTAASVDHECVLGHGVHIAPGAHLTGCVEVGDYTMVGTGAVVLPHLQIGKNAIVGAGAVVIESVPDNAVVVGNPARIIRYRNEGK